MFVGLVNGREHCRVRTRSDLCELCVPVAREVGVEPAVLRGLTEVERRRRVVEQHLRGGGRLVGEDGLPRAVALAHTLRQYFGGVSPSLAVQLAMMASAPKPYDAVKPKPLVFETDGADPPKPYTLALQRRNKGGAR